MEYISVALLIISLALLGEFQCLVHPLLYFFFFLAQSPFSAIFWSEPHCSPLSSSLSSYFVPFKYNKICILCLFFNSTVTLRLTFSCFAVLVDLLWWTTSPQGWLLFHPPFLSECHFCNSSMRLKFSYSSFAVMMTHLPRPWYIPTPRGWLLVLAYIC